MDVKKVYFEKQSRGKAYPSSFRNLTAYLKKHPDIENVILNDDETVIFEGGHFVGLLKLERTIYLVGSRYTRIVTVGDYEESQLAAGG